jgi:hypothetical protein
MFGVTPEHNRHCGLTQQSGAGGARPPVAVCMMTSAASPIRHVAVGVRDNAVAMLCASSQVECVAPDAEKPDRWPGFSVGAGKLIA